MPLGSFRRGLVDPLGGTLEMFGIDTGDYLRSAAGGLGRFFGFGPGSGMEGRLADLMERYQGRGDRAEGAFLEGIMGFDARDALKESTGALFDIFSEDLTNQLADFEGRRAGNVRSGFTGQEAREQITNPLFDRFSRQAASQALAAENLNLSALRTLGDYGVSRSGQALDIATGQLERDQQDRASRRNLLGSLLGGLGTIGGALAFSDEGLKTDVRKSTGSLERLKEIEGKEWDWTEGGRAVSGRSGRDRGVSAQEVERSFPEHVVRDERTGYRKVNYGHRDTGLVGDLVNGVNELSGRLDQIEERLGKAA